MHDKQGFSAMTRVIEILALLGFLLLIVSVIILPRPADIIIGGLLLITIIVIIIYQIRGKLEL